MSKLFDSHCHLADIDAPELSIITEQAQASDITLLTVSKSIDDWDSTLELSRLFPSVIPAVGIHPWFINKDSITSELHLLREVIESARGLIVLGEIGLDFDSEYANTQQEQLDVFQRQVEMAAEFELAVSVHCRKAFEEVRGVFVSKKYSRAIMHGFSGSHEQAKLFVDMGCKIGIGTQVLNRQSSKYERLVAKTPLDALVLETDAPYGRHGQSLTHFERLYAIASRIAEIKKMDIDEVVNMTYDSAKSIIGNEKNA